MSFKLSFAFGIVLASVPACTTYDAKPLPTTASLQMELPQAVLDGEAVTQLAIKMNPELKLAKDEEKIAQAQWEATGLFNNTQVTLGYTIPIQGDITSSQTAGIGFDVNSLINYGSVKRGAEADVLRASLSYRWQEWQTANQARLLFTKITYAESGLHILKQSETVLLERSQRVKSALAEGNYTLNASATDGLVLGDLKTKINDLEKQILGWRCDMAALLGLTPGIHLELKGEIPAIELTDEAVMGMENTLANRRPDLLALAAAYQSTEEKVRQAVMGQFPTISIGATKSHDTSGIASSSFGISLNLPIFDRGQGAIGIQKATREKVYDEYQARINAATGEIRRILMERRLLDRQYNELKAAEPKLQDLISKAEEALLEGNIDALVYSDLKISYLNKVLERINAEEIKKERLIALETLVGHSK